MTSRIGLVLAVLLGASGCGGLFGGGGVSSNGGAAGVILIDNESSTTICYAMISSSSDPNWGPDQLGSDTIPAGQSYAWSVGSGVWDVQLQDCDHSVMSEQRGVDVSSSGVMLTVTD